MLKVAYCLNDDDGDGDDGGGDGGGNNDYYDGDGNGDSDNDDSSGCGGCGEVENEVVVVIMITSLTWSRCAGNKLFILCRYNFTTLRLVAGMLWELDVSLLMLHAI